MVCRHGRLKLTTMISPKLGNRPLGFIVQLIDIRTSLVQRCRSLRQLRGRPRKLSLKGFTTACCLDSLPLQGLDLLVLQLELAGVVALELHDPRVMVARQLGVSRLQSRFGSVRARQGVVSVLERLPDLRCRRLGEVSLGLPLSLLVLELLLQAPGIQLRPGDFGGLVSLDPCDLGGPVLGGLAPLVAALRQLAGLPPQGLDQALRLPQRPLEALQLLRPGLGERLGLPHRALKSVRLVPRLLRCLLQALRLGLGLSPGVLQRLDLARPGLREVLRVQRRLLQPARLHGRGLRGPLLAPGLLLGPLDGLGRGLLQRLELGPEVLPVVLRVAVEVVQQRSGVHFDDAGVHLGVDLDAHGPRGEVEGAQGLDYVLGGGAGAKEQDRLAVATDGAVEQPRELAVAERDVLLLRRQGAHAVSQGEEAPVDRGGLLELRARHAALLDALGAREVHDGQLRAGALDLSRFGALPCCRPRPLCDPHLEDSMASARSLVHFRLGVHDVRTRPREHV
mmetsp:Transcript_13694/g.38905  ORF Transcript_13694/g.38905 Transcript_13694/m.38905 type:complete len:508 (+) Transcript_13694:846-2369(+)